ncbi:MAG: response regulator [Dysgonamonadaceae bacterium]|jgi:signal transduction histidine kinase/DNA-binding response OmpR family regulator|nr:response regulator [Dysgonamonadaceae bacterium]
MHQSVKIKLVVALGYGIMVALSIIGIVWIYREWLNYSKITEPYQQNQELVILSNTLATMYHAEGTMRLLTVATDSELTVEYDSLMTSVFDQLLKMKAVFQEQDMNLHLDSLNVLLLEKKENIAELVKLIKSLQNNTVKEIIQKTVLNRTDLNALDDLLLNTLQQFGDTTTVLKEKKGLFKRLSDAIKTNRPDTLQQINFYSTVNLQNVVLPPIKDTIVEFIKEINLAAQKKNAAIAAQLLLKQNELHTMNERTTVQINRIMNEMEHKEYRNNLKLMEEQTETIHRSLVIISIIAFAAIVVALFFMSWIIHSITLSQRLQHEIENGKKEVEKLLVSREQLLLTITHDIKAPISSILGYLELMLKDKPSFRGGYYIENMQQSATHILDLVRNLLDFHSLDENRQKIEQLPFSPYVLLTDIYKSFQPEAQKKEIQFEIDLNVDKEKNYISDPYRIRQIVNNILSNAIKFTPLKGSITLFAKSIKIENKTKLLLSIKDTGHGIKEQDKERIFQEFERLDYTGVNIEGSGLGLSISNKLAQLLGGSISVDSTIGKGSIFTLTIPLEEIKPEKKHYGKNRLKILFIDDDIVQLNLLTEWLKREGMILHICSSALEALQILQKEHFDIVFSDIQMPDMNGIELVERIRMSSFENAGTMPIIALSANSHLTEVRYREAGFSAFLAKPFTSQQLFDLIYQYTGKENTTGENDSTHKEKGFKALIAFAGNDSGAEKSIMRSFIEETKKNYVLLEHAFKNEKWEMVKNIAHKMLPIMKMISAKNLVPLLEDYEKGSRSRENKLLLLKLIHEKIQEAERFK